MQLHLSLSMVAKEQHLMELDHGVLVIYFIKMLYFFVLSIVHQYILTIVNIFLLVLGLGPIIGINDSVGTAEKKFTINFTKNFV